MSRKQTQFVILPNEVIYSIFDYFTPADILRAFAQLNHRYDNLVRFYVKHIDLTDGWQGNRQDLRWISETIETLKLDRLNLHVLYDSTAYESPTSSPINENSPQQGKKFLLRSVMKKILIPFQKIITTSQTWLHHDCSVARYRFSRVRSLHLIDVFYWTNIVSNMNLDSLNVSFDDDTRYCFLTNIIPQTVTRFSSNIVLNPYIFHANIIDLNVYVFLIVDLLKLVQQTPNVQHLSVTFAENFHDVHPQENYQSNRFETMATSFHRLRNLSRLSFSTKHDKDSENNERLPFDQIQLFIDRCCPDKTILKKVAVQLHHIIFDKDMWSTTVRYKNTFDQFNFYASFVVKDEISIGTIMSLVNDHFGFYIEDGDIQHLQYCFVHIYSLPFGFDKLHGFISCSELNPRSSFPSIRHLYFTETCLNRLVSFESLAERMPHLISINCRFHFNHHYNINIPVIICGQDTFSNVRFLYFISRCWHTNCLCRNLLPLLLDRMPHLQSLTTSIVDFIHDQRPLPPIKRLDIQECNFELFDILAERLPSLSTILLDDMPICAGQLSQVLSSLFIGISSLKSVFFRGPSIDWDDRTPHIQVAKKAIAQVQKKGNRLRHLKLDTGVGMPAFYLQDL